MSAAPPPLEVVLVSHGELGSGAYEAHVLGLARWLSPHVLLHHVAFASPRLFLDAAGRRRIEVLREKAASLLSGGVRVVPHGPRQQLISADGLALARAVESLGVSSPRPVLHCRASFATVVGSAARRVRLAHAALLLDSRGAMEEEARAHPGAFDPDFIRWLVSQACALSDARVAVSHALARYLRERHGASTRDVFPCAADTRRFRPDESARARGRAALGAGGDFVLGFVGGLAGWQRPDALGALFLAVRRLRPGARLLVVTPQVEEYRAFLAEAGVPQAAAHVLAASHDEVPGWLACCDATALLRDRDLVNAVASPIKLGESLACGVPVILTEGVGDASGEVARGDLGVVVDDLFLRGASDLERLRAFLATPPALARERAERCRAFALARWSWDEQVPRWLALYRRLAES